MLAHPTYDEWGLVAIAVCAKMVLTDRKWLILLQEKRVIFLDGQVSLLYGLHPHDIQILVLAYKLLEFWSCRNDRRDVVHARRARRVKVHLWWLFEISIWVTRRCDVPIGRRWKLSSRTLLIDSELAVVAGVWLSLFCIEWSTRLFVETYVSLACDLSRTFSVVRWWLACVVGCLAVERCWMWACTYWCRSVDVFFIIFLKFI